MKRYACIEVSLTEDEKTLIADAAHRLRRPKATYVRETVVAHAQKVLAAVEAPVTRAEGAAR